MKKIDAIARWDDHSFNEAWLVQFKEFGLHGLDFRGMPSTCSAHSVISTRMVRQDIEDCDFSLGKVTLSFGSSRLTKARFVSADLFDCRFGKSDLQLCDFTKSKVTRCLFDDATVNECSFRASRMKDFRSLGCSWLRAKVVKSDFTDAVFRRVEFRAAKFEECCFLGAQFIECDLRGAKFEGGSLSADQLTSCSQ